MDIYVGNLPYTATEDELAKLLAPYGPVNRVTIIKDKETGRSKGFGFIALSDESRAQAAIEAINGSDMDGRILKANACEPKPRFNKAQDDGKASKSGGHRPKSGATGGHRDSFGSRVDNYGDDGPREKGRGRKPKGSQKGKRRQKGGYDEMW